MLPAGKMQPLILSGSHADLYTADHELGHGVIAAHLHIPFDYVTVVPQKSSLGHLQLLPKRVGAYRNIIYRKYQNQYREIPIADVRRKFLINSIVVRLAGGESTAIFYGTRKGCQSDKKQAREIAATGLNIPKNEIQSFLKHLRKRAQSLVRIPYIQNTIEFLSFELVGKQTLTAREVRRRYIEVKKQWQWEQLIYRKYGIGPQRRAGNRPRKEGRHGKTSIMERRRGAAFSS